MTDPAPTTPAAVLPHAVQLQIQVKDNLKTSVTDGTVQKRVVQALTDQEIANRTDLLTKAIVKRGELARDLDKIRPDAPRTRNADGTEKPAEWTDAGWKKKEKAKQDLDKLDKAIAKAVDTGDYGDLKKANGGGSKPDAESDESSEG